MEGAEPAPSRACRTLGGAGCTTSWSCTTLHTHGLPHRRQGERVSSSPLGRKPAASPGRTPASRGKRKPALLGPPAPRPPGLGPSSLAPRPRPPGLGPSSLALRSSGDGVALVRRGLAERQVGGRNNLAPTGMGGCKHLLCCNRPGGASWDCCCIGITVGCCVG